MPCLASFFDAMSGVKKLKNITPAITYPTSANEPSNVGKKGQIGFKFIQLIKILNDNIY